MSREQISHGRAVLTGLAIIVYFAVLTAWFPSALLRSSFLATAPRGVADGITTVVWGGLLGVGIIGLRLAQKRELI